MNSPNNAARPVEQSVRRDGKFFCYNLNCREEANLTNPASMAGWSTGLTDTGEIGYACQRHAGGLLKKRSLIAPNAN